MKPEISVIVVAYNEERFISKCIKSILNQTYKNFELIIVDDCSTDKTEDIIKSFKDGRIIYLKNIKNIGIARTRNRGIIKAKGKYIFFTDADCEVDKNWLNEGIRYIKREKCLAIEGLIHYVSKDYKATYCDKVISTYTYGQFMTANILYRKEVFKKIAKFNPQFEYNSDRALALDILKRGKIGFCKKMIVTHQKDEWNFKEFIKSGNRISSRVYLFKHYKENNFIFWKIVNPENLLTIFFPPLIFFSFFKNRYKHWKDFKLFLGLYPKLVFERYILWKTAIKERIFLI